MTPIPTTILLGNDLTAVAATPAAADANEKSSIPAAPTANTHANWPTFSSEGSTSNSLSVRYVAGQKSTGVDDPPPSSPAFSLGNNYIEGNNNEDVDMPY